MTRDYGNSGSYIWNSQQGNILYPTDWLLRSFVFIISFLGVSGEVLTKGLLIISLTLCGYGSYFLSRKIGLGYTSSFFTGLVYVFSPIVFTRTIAGYVYYLISYFVAPFVVAFFIEGSNINKKISCNLDKVGRYKNFIIAGLLFSFSIQIQFFIIVPLILIIIFLIVYRTKQSFIGIMIILSIAFMVNIFPFFITTIFSGASIDQQRLLDPEYLLNSYHEIKTAPNLYDGFRLLGYSSHPYSYQQIGTINDPLFFYQLYDMIKYNKTQNLLLNSDFMKVVLKSTATKSQISSSDSTTSSVSFPAYWTDKSGKCNGEDSSVKCKIVNKYDVGIVEKADRQPASNTGGDDVFDSISDNVFQISTNITKPKSWISIISNEIPVKSGQKYIDVVNMKLNEFARSSHAVLDGFNETSDTWVQIDQCPSGTSGPTGWKRYICAIDIAEHITKLRLVLNAGWSSSPSGMDAITYYGGVQLIRINGDYVFETDFNNLISNNYLTANESYYPNNNQSVASSGSNNNASTSMSTQSTFNSSKFNYTKINPTLWRISINNSENKNDNISPEKHQQPLLLLGFAESFSPLWEARVFQNGTLLETSKSQPLYGAINGFEIHHKGNLSIDVRYKPQDLFEIGIKMSLLSLFLIVVFLLVLTLKAKRTHIRT
jgi:hypothetical protein